MKESVLFPLCALCIFIEDLLLGNERIHFSSFDVFLCQYYAIVGCICAVFWNQVVYYLNCVLLASDYLFC